MLRTALFIGFSLLGQSDVFAQQNPFEIQGRTPQPPIVSRDSIVSQPIDTLLESTPIIAIDSSGTVPTDSISTILNADTSQLGATPDTSSNPFEQIPEQAEEEITLQPATPTPPPDKDTADLLEGLKEISEHLPQIEIDQNQNVLFVITVLILLLLAILLAVNRSMINKAYRAIANDNFLRFLFREYKSMPWLYWVFYFYFFINAGLFLYLLANEFGWFGGQLSLLILSIFGVGMLYIIKQISLQILAFSFPVEKETQLYGFVTMLINILLGVVLTPINLIAAFAPEPFANWAIWSGAIIVVGLYFFRQLKGLFIAGRFLHSYRFHFFIYLCTAEIAPLLIIGKFAFDKFGI